MLATLLTNPVKFISWSSSTFFWKRPPNSCLIFSHTDCFRRNPPYLERKCLRLLYINIIKKFLYFNLDFYGDMVAKKMWFSCGSRHWTCLTLCVILTVRRFVLETIAKTSHTETKLLCRILGSLKKIFMK